MARGGVIFNPDVQSDIDMKNTYKLLNYPGSGNTILSVSNTIYIDSVNGTSGGQRGTTSAFQNLSQALAVAQNGDAIVFRTGTQATITSSLTTSLNNLLILGNEATLTGSSSSIAGGGWFLKFTGTGCVVDGLILDGNRGSDVTNQGWGLFEVTAANTIIRNCVFKNALGAGIHVTATGLDRVQIRNNEFNGTFSGITADNLSGAGEMFFQITGNRIHDSWATAGLQDGAIKLLNLGAATIGGDLSLNTIWNWPRFSATVGIELQGTFKRCNIVGNQVRGSGYAITLDGVQESDLIGNRVSNFTDSGIEMSAAVDVNSVGNTIEGGGTGNGYLVADTGGTRITIEGGSVSDCAVAISGTFTSSAIKSVSFYAVPAGVDVIYSHNSPGPLLIENCDVYFDGAARFLDQLMDGATNATHIDVIGNRFRGKPTSEIISYNHTAAGTITDCDVAYNTIDTANNLPANGFVRDVSGGTIRQRFNSPINNAIDFNATDTAGVIKPVGKVDLNPATSDWINAELRLYNRMGDTLNQVASFQPATGLTTSPSFINLGQNYATVGTHGKLILYDGGDSGGSNSYVIGIADGLWYGVPTGKDHEFLVNGSIVARIAPNVITNGTITWTKGAGSPEGVVSAPVGSTYTRTDGGAGTTFYVKESGSGNTGWVGGVSTVGGGATIANTSTILAGDGAGNAVGTTETGSGDTVRATSPTLVTPTIGVATATSVNKWTLTAPSTAATLTAGADGLTYTLPEITTKIGFRHIPQNSQSVAYTTVLNDSGKHIYHPASDANNRIFTIDSNANVAYPIGTAIMFVNMSANNLSIAITADTMYLAGVGTTGTRTLAQYGKATAVKTNTTEWVIAGIGLS